MHRSVINEQRLRLAQGGIDIALRQLEYLINATPTGVDRCLLCDANIEMSRALEALQKVQRELA